MSGSPAAGLLSLVRHLDAYPKTLEDFRVQTTAGGAITLTSALIMILLFTAEIRDYLQPQVREELFVDTTRGEDNRLKINFDLIVHRISCDYLTVDAMDVSGEQHIGVEHNIYKRRLDLDGKPLEEAVRAQGVGESAKIVNQTVTEENKTAKTKEVVTCGSCYGAESADVKCCNTCDDVRRAYQKKTWKFDPRGIEQCGGEVGEASEREKLALKEGCQIYGYLEVNRVGGSFHFGPGKSFSINHMHVHDVQPFASTDFNLTHTIRHVSFGRQVAATETDQQGVASSAAPLDGSFGFDDRGATMFQYYLKIVPTTYARSDDRVFLTNQFSVTRHQKHTGFLSGEGGMPGIFFSYELAPFMVKYSEKEKSLAHFMTGLCAIIGGIFTVAGILDKLVYSSARIIQKKTELGKLG